MENSICKSELVNRIIEATKRGKVVWSLERDGVECVEYVSEVGKQKVCFRKFCFRYSPGKYILSIRSGQTVSSVPLSDTDGFMLLNAIKDRTASPQAIKLFTALKNL